MLEASPEDIEIEGAEYRVKGSPEKKKTLQEIAFALDLAFDTPEGMEPYLDETAYHDTPNCTFPFGTHIAIVEVDEETGHGRPRPLHRGGRRRQEDQPDDRRRPAPRRHRPGRRPGAVGGGGLQRRRPAAVGLDARLRAAAGLVAAELRARRDRDPVARSTRSGSRASARPGCIARPRRWPTRSSTRSARWASATSTCPTPRRRSGARSRAPSATAPRREARHDPGGVRVHPGGQRRRGAAAPSPRDDGAKVIAGGQSLLPLLKLRLASAETLVDIGRLSRAPRASSGSTTGGCQVGALTTYAELMDSPASHYGVLRDALPTIGDVQVRNRGTVGGSVAHADPALGPAGGARSRSTRRSCSSRRGGTRTVKADGFFEGPFQTGDAPRRAPDRRDPARRRATAPGPRTPPSSSRPPATRWSASRRWWSSAPGDVIEYGRRRRHRRGRPPVPGDRRSRTRWSAPTGSADDVAAAAASGRRPARSTRTSTRSASTARDGGRGHTRRAIEAALAAAWPERRRHARTGRVRLERIVPGRTPSGRPGRGRPRRATCASAGERLVEGPAARRRGPRRRSATRSRRGRGRRRDGAGHGGRRPPRGRGRRSGSPTPSRGPGRRRSAARARAGSTSWPPHPGVLHVRGPRGRAASTGSTRSRCSRRSTGRSSRAGQLVASRQGRARTSSRRRSSTGASPWPSAACAAGLGRAVRADAGRGARQGVAPGGATAPGSSGASGPRSSRCGSTVSGFEYVPDETSTRSTRRWRADDAGPAAEAVDVVLTAGGRRPTRPTRSSSRSRRSAAGSSGAASRRTRARCSGWAGFGSAAVARPADVRRVLEGHGRGPAAARLADRASPPTPATVARLAHGGILTRDSGSGSRRMLGPSMHPTADADRRRPRRRAAAPPATSPAAGPPSDAPPAGVARRRATIPDTRWSGRDARPRGDPRPAPCRRPRVRHAGRHRRRGQEPAGRRARPSRRCRERDGRIAFVPLDAVSDASMVLPAIAGALGVARRARPAARRGARGGAGRRAQRCCVLDTMEHVRAAAPALADLHARTPGLTILATSRVALGVPRERVVWLEPLPVPAGD